MHLCSLATVACATVLGLGDADEPAPPNSTAPPTGPPAPRRPSSPGTALREPPRPDGTYPLAPDRSGNLRYSGDAFTATIRPDGSVEFRDVRGSAGFKLFGFDPVRRRLDAPVDRRDPAWAAFSDRAIYPMGQFPLLVSAGGNFGGLSDWTRANKHAAAKQAFLRATEPLRTRMALAWLRRQLQAQLAELGPRLVALWRDPKLPPDERRRRLFRLWDECDESSAASASPPDVLRAASARLARAKVAVYVRLVAPPGSPDAFTDRELARLNAGRRSVAAFRPYDAPVDPPADLPELDELTAPTEPEPPEPPADPPAHGPAPPPAWDATAR